MAVQPNQRHTRRRRCPICEGADQDKRGKGERCNGFTSSDGDYEHCSREEYAGGIQPHPKTGLYPHRMHGECNCGQTHGEAKANGHDSDIECTYDYHDEHGALLYQVVRKRGKRFFQRRPDALGGWVWSIGDIRRVLYRLPLLVGAPPDERVYVVEGEKDADTLGEQGLIATCNPMGARKWSFVAGLATKVLAQRDVVVIADADKEGRTHAGEVHSSLLGVAKSVRVVELPGVKDATEYFEAGGTVAGLLSVVDGVEPETKKAFPFEILSATELWAPLEKPKYLIEDVIREASVTEIVAYGGGSKSWMGVDGAVAVGSGLRWLGRFETTQSRALFIDWENGNYELRRRLQAITLGRGLVGPIENVEAIIMPPIYLTGDNFEETMMELARDRRFIVIDTLKAASPGVDENSSEIRRGLDALRRVAEKTGCAFVVLVHGKKTSGNVTELDLREAGRGSSAIFDAADSVFHVAYKKGKPLRVVQTKSRLGRYIDSFDVVVEDTDDGGVVLRASDAPTDTTEDQARSFEERCQTVLDAVRATPGQTRTELADRLKRRPASVQAALERLERDGAVRNIGHKNHQRWVPITHN